jgi:hypothetical protein
MPTRALGNSPSHFPQVRNILIEVSHGRGNQLTVFFKHWHSTKPQYYQFICAKMLHHKWRPQW